MVLKTRSLCGSYLTLANADGQTAPLLVAWNHIDSATVLESLQKDECMVSHCICVCSSIVWFIRHEVCTAGALKNEIDVAHTIAIVALHLCVDVIHRHDLCATPFLEEV